MPPVIKPKKQVKLNILQSEFINLPHKIRGFVGGYGSSKTYSGCVAMCKEFRKHPGINQGYFAPTYAHIRDIFFETIEEVASNMLITVDIKESNKEVHFYKNGRFLGTAICRSMEKPHSIIGFKIGHALIDEIDLLPMHKATIAYRKILARMRYNIPGLKNGIDITTTPEGFKFAHKLFVTDIALKPELKATYAMVQASTYENEVNLPDDYIQTLLDAYPPELISAYLNGQFTNLTSGTVYRGYNRKANRSKEQMLPFEPLFIGMDFNVDHMAATIYVQRSNGFHAVAELKDIFDTPSIIKIIKEKYQSDKKTVHKLIYVYPDSSGKNRKSNDASITDITLLKSAGFQLRYKSTNPFVKDRVAATNKAFADGWLHINDTLCPTVATNFEQQAYDDNGEPDKKTGMDHQNDASTYPIAYERPIKRVYVGASRTAKTLKGYWE